jgi:hypothetical protein
VRIVPLPYNATRIPVIIRFAAIVTLLSFISKALMWLARLLTRPVTRGETLGFSLIEERLLEDAWVVWIKDGEI